VRNEVESDGFLAHADIFPAAGVLPRLIRSRRRPNPHFTTSDAPQQSP
jgi:hypothetical protein